VRDDNGVKVLELEGKITIGSGDVQMRETINELVNGGSRKIVVDMGGVTTLDSSGVGELVGCYTSVKNKGGALKLCGLTEKIQDLLAVTQLITVFEVYEDQAKAVASFA